MKFHIWPALTLSVFSCTVGISATQAADTDPAVPTKVVYTFSPSNYFAKVKAAPNEPWQAEMVSLPEGGEGLAAGGRSLGYNNYLIVTKDKFKAEHDYTAILKYRIVTPTKFPNSFHLFARSSKLGQANDVWRIWNGDPGDRGEARLTFSTKGPKASDDWMVYGGSKGPGTMIIDSFQVVEGNGYEYKPAETGVKHAPQALPAPFKQPTGATPFTLEPPAPKKGLSVSTQDFGLIPDGANGPVSTEVATANFTALSAALKACRERGASVLSIPNGVYRFFGREAIPFTDLSDLTIDAQGSTFVFEKLHTGLEAISVYRCERVVIKNLKIDWDWDVTPIASLARVVSASEDGKSCELTFPDLSPTQLEATKKAPWMSMTPIDPVSLTRITTINEPRPSSVANIENAGVQNLRVTFKNPGKLHEGDTYSVRHLYYDFGCFKVGSCHDLAFEGVTIYSIPGMGWFFTSDIRNFRLSNCKITRPSGSRRPLTTAADGFHVSQSQGNFTLEGCEFTGSGDDSINIHDNCFQGVQRIDDHTLALINCQPWRIRLNVGDRIELFHANYAPLGFTSAVQAVATKDNDTVLTLAETLPADLSPLSIVLNRRFDTHNVRISGCQFHDTNGRSILLSAHDATIENCTFDNAVGTAIQFHTEIVGNPAGEGTLWAEGSGASNVVVRNNTFKNTSFEGRYENAVVYSGAKLPTGVTTYPLFHDLLIENNRFINCSGPAISLSSAKNVIVRGNQLSAPQTTPVANALAGSLFTAYASDLLLTGNTWQSVPTVGTAGVVSDPATTSNIVTQNNTVLK